jgi:hypothetical protein
MGHWGRKIINFVINKDKKIAPNKEKSRRCGKEKDNIRPILIN